MKKTILIIDDDTRIGSLEEEVLTKEGYSCLRAYSGTEAILLLEHTKPDLILLDLMLPGMSGEDVLAGIKEIPVIAVSAKGSTDDKVALLKSGAVDYITKPFDTKELAARVEVALRKTAYQPVKDILRYADITVDTTSRTASVCGTVMSLTKTEYAILKLLVKHPEQVIAKSVILDRISDDTLDCTEGSLKTHVSHLRTKLREISGKDYIEAIWGIGFRLIDG